jgi:hypothetical protein
MKLWEKKLDIFAPIQQAERCLDRWLESEHRTLTQKQKQRVTALMARYFHHEDEVSDALMMSFLNHYSGHAEVDIEDPTSVRMEIKSLLDKSQFHNPAPSGRSRMLAAFVGGALIVAVSAGAWEVTHRAITKTQQAELKALVHQIAELDHDATSAGIWSEVKQPLQVKSYQDITWWGYLQGREILEKRLKELQRKP